MQVLLTSADGFIGKALARALVVRGHAVTGLRRAGRTEREALPGLRYQEGDFAASLVPADWRVRLDGIDVVVNTVGILREDGQQSFETVHVRAPTALFRAAAERGVRRVIQVSALGADGGARSAYHRSKAQADAVLATLVNDWAVVQPSLVFGPDGRSARWFEMLASLPVIPMPGDGMAPVQPIHLDDLVDAIVRLVEAPSGSCRRLALVGPRACGFRDFLALLRRALGLGEARFAIIPLWLTTPLVMVASLWPGGLVDRETLGMLLRGNAAPPDDTIALLGRTPRAIEEFVPAAEREGRAARARLRWLLPLLRASIALVWWVAAVVAVAVFPLAKSYALLARAGVPAMFAPAALFGAAALDLLCGVACLWPRRRPWWWLAQAALVVGYTAVISVRLPEFWAHPYGPIVKNVPLVVVMVLLYAFETRS